METQKRKVIDVDEAPAPADEHLTDFAGYNLKRLFTLVQNDLSRVLADLDLRIISYSVLSVVVRNPGINQTRLAEALKLERSNLVQIVEELSTRALITRAPIENNRRSHALLPTSAGSTLVERADLAVADHESRMFSALSATELLTLNRLLLKVRKANE
jgi:DNA-binding MarR family transcriptional regulator